MATSTDAQAAPKNEMKLELNFSWFTKKDKPLISFVPRDHKSSSSSSGSSSSSEEEINPFEKWLEATQRKEITLVTAGRSGVGKSTLVQSLLRLTGEADLVPQSRHSPSSVTTEVKVYSSYRAEEEITIRMIDMPGLFTSDVNDSRVLAELQEKTGGRCDMMLYCVSLLPDSKIDKEDKQIIDKLTRVFGKEVLEHTLLVLTFANAVKELYPDQSIEDLVEEYGKKFQSVLGKHVVSVYSSDHEQNLTQKDPPTIVALPAGSSQDERFIDHLPVGWNETIFLEVLNKCHPGASAPQVFLAKSPWPSSRHIRIPLTAALLVIATGFVTIIGAPCIPLGLPIIGIGKLIELFTTRFSGAFSTAAGIGTLTGGVIFGAYYAHEMFVEQQRYEAEQYELEEIQNEIKSLQCTAQNDYDQQ